jgi:hypothetical protein
MDHQIYGYIFDTVEALYYKHQVVVVIGGECCRQMWVTVFTFYPKIYVDICYECPRTKD